MPVTAARAARPAWWPLAEAMLEDDLSKSVLDLCVVLGISAYHPRPAYNARGRVLTPLQGDAGYPDWTLAYRGAVIWRELKKQRARPRPEQEVWLAQLGQAARIWRPSDWFDGSIRAELEQLRAAGDARRLRGVSVRT